MWSDMGFEIPIIEGTYWLDNGIIKGFTSDGIIHKLYSYKVFDDLSIKITKHKDNKKELVFETWNETVKRFESHLNDLEQDSINLIKQHSNDNKRSIICLNSTGKDSMVVDYLLRKTKLPYKTYFNVTTLDVPESNVMAKRNNYHFTYPDKKYKGFYIWRKKENIIPTRLNRCCCKYFKEEATIKDLNANEKYLLLLGMRNEESNSRSEYEDIWINEKWGIKRDWIGLLPIRKWTELDVWLYIIKNNIEINKKYRMGYSRVGCGIACPNYSKSTWVLDKYWYNNLYNRWQNILKQDFIINNKWLIMNCTIDEYCSKYWNGGIAYTEPTEDCIKEFSQYSGIDYNIAKSYFNKYCTNGCLNKRGKVTKITNKDVLSMNLKLYGRNIEKFKCKKCIMKDLQWTNDDWNNMIDRFKLQGCQLF